ncbi:MAG: hypothetical protein J7L21_06645 [Sulfurimonas sp.]|nr:hypothetical protein [Sulfurimonas sp.]
MKKLKVKLLTGRSSTEGSNSPGDKIDLPINEAVSLVSSGQAEAVNKQAYEAALKSIEAKKLEDEEQEVKVNAILQKETLELELRELYRAVAVKSSELNGVILNEDEIEQFVTTSMEGEEFKGEGE